MVKLVSPQSTSESDMRVQIFFFFLHCFYDEKSQLFSNAKLASSKNNQPVPKQRYFLLNHRYEKAIGINGLLGFENKESTASFPTGTAFWVSKCLILALVLGVFTFLIFFSWRKKIFN